MQQTKEGLRYLKSGLILLANMLVAMTIGSIFLILQGESPAEVYYHLLIAPLQSAGGIIKVLGKATPLIFTGLASAVAFRCGIFNIGVEGQLYLGGFVAAVVAANVSGAPALVGALAVLAAAAAGGALALFAGWLKTRFGIHEVISTIMLNYITTNIVTYLLVSFFKEPGSTPRTPTAPEGARLAQFFPPEHLNWGLVLALLLVGVVLLLINYTPFGWHIDSAGANMLATRYAGINAKGVILGVMLLSGAIAGLCGAERSLGAYGYMELGFSPGYGFDGMAVAIIAKNNPVGSVAVALLFGLMYYGGININMWTNVPSEWVSSLIAIMLILVAAESGIFHSLLAGLKSLRGGAKA